MRAFSKWAGAVLIALVLSPMPVSAASGVDCEMRFTLSSWSIFYKTAKGSGTITCSNGQTMAVNLRAKGGGFTVGKSTIDDGRGEFSGVGGIAELLGTYVSAEANAGAVKAVKGQVVTKGEVSLALAGTGRGWDLGVAFGKFIIRRR